MAAIPSARAKSTWRVGVLADDLPFSRVVPPSGAQTRPVQGLYVDWWRALGRVSKHEVLFVACKDNQDCINRLKRGDVDFVGPAPYVGDESLSFTRPVNRRYIFCVAFARRPCRTPLDLSSRNVAVVGDARNDLRELSAWSPASLSAVSAHEARQRLIAGAVDVIITNRMLDVEMAFQSERNPLWFRWQHIYARAEDILALQQLDQAIDALDPSEARIEQAGLPVGADELLLPSDARPAVDRKALAFLAEHPTIRLGASKWEPLTAYKDGRYDGLALRVVSHHLQRAGLTSVYVGEDDWRKVKEDARAGVYDGLGFILVRPDSQLAPLIFTEEMIDLPMVAVARSDAEFWAGLEDVTGQRIVGNPIYGELSETIESVEMTGFVAEEDPARALALIRSGRADAWIEYLPVAQGAIWAVGATDVKLAFRLGGPRGARTALRPEWAPVVPLINSSIQNTGREELWKIYAGWTARSRAAQGSSWPTTILAGVISVLAGGVVVLARRLGRQRRTVRQRERALRRAQLLSGVGSVELHPPFTRVFLDGETSKVLGIHPAVEVQSLDEHLSLFTDRDRLRRAIDQGKDGTEAIGLDVTVDIDGQEPQVFRYEIAPPRPVDGRLVMTGTIRNVTQERARRAHERELEQQILQLQKQDAIGRLAGGIAHDFNNILAASIGYTELAMVELPAEHPAHQNMERVLSASLRSRDLVKQILTFSRSGDGQHEAMRLDACVADAFALMRASTPASVTLSTELPSEAVWVEGDPTQLTQVLVNLITNAVDAIQGPGTVVVGLDLVSGSAMRFNSSESSVTYARLSVSDSGPGIDEAIRHQIFDPFFTTKPRGKGTGLGLSIVHGVVTSHQGHIELMTGSLGGARFEVFLPRISEPVIDASVKVSVEPSNGKSILVVDDEAALTQAYVRMLERYGFRVTAFNCSVEALQAVAAEPNRYDLLLTDLTMPRLSGIELATETRRINAKLPVVLVTGYQADVPKGSKGLFCEVLQKPLTGDQLVLSVNRALGSQRTGTP